MSDAAEAGLAEALAEIATLRTESARLRNLLGLNILAVTPPAHAEILAIHTGVTSKNLIINF